MHRIHSLHFEKVFGVEKMKKAAQKIHHEALDPNRKYTDVEKKILEPVNYVVQNRGKKVREKFTKALNFWMQTPEHTINTVVASLSPLHDLSLILDDIQDDSTVRRGLPCAHLVFGIPRTLSAVSFGIWVSFQNMIKIGTLKQLKYKNLFGRHLIHSYMEILRGQASDVFWRDFFVCPSEEEYMEMVSLKTGTGLAYIADNLITNHCDEFIRRLGNLLGRCFQVRDDYVNLTSVEYMKKKGFCEDIEEGKFSFPIIHAIRSHPEDNTVLNILKQRTKDKELKRYCLSILEKYNSLEYTKKKIDDLEEEIKKITQSLGINKLFSSLLDELDVLHGTF